MLCHSKAECLSPHKTIPCSVYTYLMTLHFVNRRAAALLRHRSRTTATVLVCEQRPYTDDYRGGANVIRYLVPRSPKAKGKGDLTFQRKTE